MFKKRFKTKDCTLRAFWAGAALLALARRLLLTAQQGYIWVGGAPLDDELMFRAAQSISAGQWLGEYDYLTLSKSMFFPVWLALLNALRISFLAGGLWLWLAAALLAAQAFAPVLPRRKGRLLLFAVLAFSPSSWAAYTLRVYRDNIFPVLCLICFAGFAGALLRAVQAQKRTLWPWLLAAGAGLGAGYLNREDAGMFLLPFALAATLAMLAVLARKKRWLCMAAQAIPYGVLAAGVAAFCTLNYQYYGLFALSDFASGSFADAIGAMNRVAGAYEQPQYVTIPAQARAAMYEVVPELQPLQYWLEEDPQLQNDFRDPALADYRAGSFYWAIRRAAQFEGVYESAQTAQEYWAAVAAGLNAACDSGALPCKGGARSGTTPPVEARYVLPVLAESAKGALWALTFQDCAPYEKLRSIGTEEDFAAWSAYLHCTFNGAAEAGKDTPYYSPMQKLLFGAMQAVRYLYAAALPLTFLYALYLQIKKVRRVIKGGKNGWQGEAPALFWLLWGLLAMAALRCAMIAFVEVASFGIGTSTMYLATVHPLLLLFTAGTILTERGRAHG